MGSAVYLCGWVLSAKICPYIYEVDAVFLRVKFMILGGYLPVYLCSWVVRAKIFY